MPRQVLTLNLHGVSSSNMDQYTLEQLYTNFGAFIRMWKILPNLVKKIDY